MRVFNPMLLAAGAAALLAASSSQAADDGESSSATVGAPRTSANGTPITAYAYGAAGVPAGTVGASTSGYDVTGAPSNGSFGGGGTVWASPVDRLTLIGDARRTVTADFAPSATVLVRLFGVPDEGWTFGALGKFKIDGFSRGPRKELESEVESGFLLSYGKDRVHFDLNGLTGFGLGDDGEIDTEGRLRLGYDVLPYLRLGVDEQARYRVRGTSRLPGDRMGDLAGGAQVLFSWKNFFAAVTGGPSTMGVVDTKVGWMALVTLGGVTL